MLTLSEQRCLPCSPQQIFDVVANVAEYPDFLPGVLTAKVTPLHPQCFQADLVMGYKTFREPYRCLVHFQPYESIAIEYLEGPFANLTNNWEFQPTATGVNVSFFMAFAFRNSLLQGLARSFSTQIKQQMIAAFETRAVGARGQL